MTCHLQGKEPAYEEFGWYAGELGLFLSSSKGILVPLCCRESASVVHALNQGDTKSEQLIGPRSFIVLEGDDDV